MKSATPIPTITNASSTLMTAMTVRMMLVVPRLPSICTSEGSRLMRIGLVHRLTGRGTAVVHRVVHQAPAFVRHDASSSERAPEMVELASQIVERWFDTAAKFAPLRCEHHIARDAADDRADDRRSHRP